MARRSIHKNPLVSTVNYVGNSLLLCVDPKIKISSLVLEGDRPSVVSIQGVYGKFDGCQGTQQVRSVSGGGKMVMRVYCK